MNVCAVRTAREHDGSWLTAWWFRNHPLPHEPESEYDRFKLIYRAEFGEDCPTYQLFAECKHCGSVFAVLNAVSNRESQ